MSKSPKRKRTARPNILITGTPGVGKSRLCRRLSTTLAYNWVDVSKLAKQLGCATEYDEAYRSYVLEEDKLLDRMEEMMAKGGNIVDYHGCDFFPERWFRAVFVLRSDNTVLYDRLIARGYEGKKLEENIQCEIFQTILEEAMESYNHSKVYELANNTMGDFKRNKKLIKNLLRKIENETA